MEHDTQSLNLRGVLVGHPVKFPQLDLGTTMPLLFGMLGVMNSWRKLGALRNGVK